MVKEEDDDNIVAVYLRAQTGEAERLEMDDGGDVGLIFAPRTKSNVKARSPILEAN